MQFERGYGSFPLTKKIKPFLWRVLSSTLPSRVVLRLILEGEETQCALCGVQEET